MKKKVLGSLWINPFLDEFYWWGYDKFWIEKRHFIQFLDNPIAAGIVDEENGKRFIPKEITEYLLERVPEWYFPGENYEGEEFDNDNLIIPATSMTINAFSVHERYLDEIIFAWENDMPFKRGFKVEFYSDGFRTESGYTIGQGNNYKEYPPELEKEGCMLTIPVFSGYVKLLKIESVLYNSIYFTAVQGHKWNSVIEQGDKISFMNWTQTNPMGVKE